jgi:hypothetical protein
MTAATPSPDVKPMSAKAAANSTFGLSLAQLPDASEFTLKTPLRSPHLLESPTGFLPSNGFGSHSTKKRPRNMSHSSTERELSHEGLPQTSDPTSADVKAISKKRASTDTIDYPRRRATIAVSQMPDLYNQNMLTMVVRNLSLEEISM